MDPIVLSYKNIIFPQFLRGVSINYSGPPRIDPLDADQRERAAYERGRQEATDELNEQILRNRGEVQHLLGETLELLEQKIDTCLKDIMDEIPALVTTIARRVLADIELDGVAIKAVVDDVICDLPSNKDQIEVYLNPKDLELFHSYVENIEKDYPHCTFIADPHLKAADCRVESKFGAIDASVDTKLKHIEDQLRS
jgi:flagellar assembly protein FliH